MDVFIPLFFMAGIGLVIVGGTAGVVLYMVWYFSRSRRLLDQWAAANGYRILESEVRLFFRGPYFMISSNAQTVYRVKVLDRQGNTKSGWVKCGSFFLGVFEDKVEARWEPEATC